MYRITSICRAPSSRDRREGSCDAFRRNHSWRRAGAPPLAASICAIEILECWFGWPAPRSADCKCTGRPQYR